MDVCVVRWMDDGWMMDGWKMNTSTNSWFNHMLLIVNDLNVELSVMNSWQRFYDIYRGIFFD